MADCNKGHAWGPWSAWTTVTGVTAPMEYRDRTCTRSGCGARDSQSRTKTS